MMGMLTADFSRLKRSRGFYIIIIISLALLAIFATAAYFVTGFAQEMTQMEMTGPFMTEDLLQRARRAMNLNFFASFYLSHNNVLHLLVALFAAGFISRDHQTGYLKNLMTVPGLRHKWLISKLLVTALAAAAFYLVFLAACVVTVLLYGNQPVIMAGELARYFGLHLLVDLAIFSLICLIVCLTQARAVAIVLALLVSFNMQSILYLLIDSLGILPFKLRAWGMMGQASRLPLQGGIVSMMGEMREVGVALTKESHLLFVALGIFLFSTALSLWAIRRVDYKG